MNRKLGWKLSLHAATMVAMLLVLGACGQEAPPPSAAAKGDTTIVWGNLNVGTDPIMLTVLKGAASGADSMATGCIASLMYPSSGAVGTPSIYALSPGADASKYSVTLAPVLASGSGISIYSQHVVVKRTSAATAKEIVFVQVSVTIATTVHNRYFQVEFNP
ncbi:MAG: hypothetical protein HONBIEJF_01587 [Fimbriimonadaceae bacterium]|nr:hypothetical protein [Fimbriimonadaceae bacterium]